MKAKINQSFIEDIKWVLKWTEHDLNGRAGLSRSYIYRIRGSEKFSADTISRLATAMLKRSQELRLVVGETIDPSLLALDIKRPEDFWHRLISVEVSDEDLAHRQPDRIIPL